MRFPRHAMDTFSPSILPEALPELSEEAVQVRLMRELFVRTRESALVDFLPVLLLGWAHWEAQPLWQLGVWAGLMLGVLVYRWLVAHLFLARPKSQAARVRAWLLLERLGAVGLAAAWVSSMVLLGRGEVDGLFHLRLICLVALAAFLLSALGINLQVYANFLVALVLGTLWVLYLHYPAYAYALPTVAVGLALYVLMLLLRSRGEYRRAREWVRARLTQRKLLDQLHQNIQQELQMHDMLRNRTHELEETNRKLGELAIHDGLTGAFRRGHIEAELRRQVKAWERSPDDFSILLLDIDHFKNVNDEYGHPTGDEVLRRLAEQVQGMLRGSDLFGRWGGEEFIVLLPGTDLDRAVEAGERLRLALAGLTFKADAGRRFCITVSIGVAHLEPGETAASLTERADKALYAAKHAGRNRVLPYEPGQTEFSPL